MSDLAPTPGQTVGPFFHYALPYDDGPRLSPPGSAGSIRLHGTVYDGAGEPVPDALLELRQADAAGRIARSEGSLHRDGRFTGWGRAATDTAGRYAFTTVEPAPARAGAAAYFAVTVFARGLLDRLFTRIYVPAPGLETDPVLSELPEERRATLVAVREADGGLRHDIRLQGEHETVFLTFPGHDR
ncbi:protocatechuate 3,4-dioxygenase subunit alpha [Prauserella rugosa]|uniref:Protocatechuate 3,4-dioxygenase alpha subunit n=1 Tax=Prauserella rugosa TaxID=43354 RepID=A0A660CAR7_9PSEU|nr:protocatechuate 3,4-dioxygenase subunit alpha [Prauserella rugosa]KID29864.1 protocatechuate 3,4-dioxygenase, alpha subunit [Prauserella sp. Am3]KMS84501.1 protocatechuate 3,4-dioxygenase [Streptomyces regensis]TWH18853.1 protocatechuate 3,4-dioxygenase alpha subunit [Prauserella rugosa]